jgi:hypothetical protein
MRKFGGLLVRFESVVMLSLDVNDEFFGGLVQRFGDAG